MKELIVIRHAKSSWSAPALTDRERPLNKRGLAAAPRVARELVDLGICPSSFVASPAVRAWDTAKVIAGAYDCGEEEIVRADEIYEASSSELLSIIGQFDESWSSVAMFGHNPGFHEIVERLLRKGGIDHFPTCAVAHLRLDVDYWGAVDDGCAELVRFFVPRDLEPED